MPSSLSPAAFLQSNPPAIATPELPARELPIGTKLGAWQVSSRSHPRGDHTGYAVTRESGEHAVLEVIEAPPLVFGSYSQRLRSVADAVGRVHHRGVVTIHEVGTLVDGRPYVVREALDGVTLAALADDQTLVDDDRLQLVREICDVLIAAHAVGVCHGALELDHVLVLSGDGNRIKLLDWGVSDVIADEARRRGKIAANAEPHAMHQRSFAGDVYDLGMLTFQLFPELPSTLEQLVVDMCEDDATKRPSIGEVARRLAEARETDKHAVVASMLPRETGDERAAVAAREPVPELLRLPRFVSSRAWKATIILACSMPLLVAAWRAYDQQQRPQQRVIANASVETARPAEPTPAVATTPRIEPAAVVAIPERPAEPPRAIEPAIQREVTVKRAKRRGTDEAQGTERGVDRALLRHYQRVGHRVITLDRRVDTDASAELVAEFRAIKIDEAMKTARSRQETSALLTAIERAAQRIRPVEISESCRNNPMADGCR